MKRVRRQPNMKLKDIQDVVQKKFTLNITLGKASRAREKAREYVDEAHTQQYNQLWEYCEEAEQYVHRCFHVSTYKACYEPVIAPINGQNMWRPSGVQPVQPPIKRIPPGKSKKKRTREASEPAGRKAGISKQCRSCGQIGQIGGNSSIPSTTNKTTAAKKVTFYHICQVNV